MAYTSPVVTHATGDVFPASDWNTYVRDNLAYLHGDAGAFVVNNSLTSAGVLTGNTGLSSGGPTSAGFTGAQPGDGVFADTTGQIASFCNAAVVAFAAGAIGDTVPRWQVDSNGNMGWGVGGGSAQDLTISRAAAGLLKIGGSGSKGNYKGGFQGTAPGLPATFAPDTAYLVNRVAPINVSGTLTIGAPANAPSATESAILFIIIKAPAAGTLTVAWNAAFNTSPVSPTTGQGIIYFFVWDGGTSKWEFIQSISE